MDFISKKTRSEFQELLVSKKLRGIEMYFDNHDVALGQIASDKLPSGERRSLVAQYYSTINWTNTKQIIQILKVYSDILNDLSEFKFSLNEDYDKKCFEKLTKLLLNDGYKFIEGKIIAIQSHLSFEDLKNATNLLDKEHFQEYIDRIKTSIDKDPVLAIGSTKELVESTLKTILKEMKISICKDDDIPKLLKQVQKVLTLVPDEVDDSKKGADIIKVLLNNLGQVVIKVAELRNLYGTGHGKDKKRKGLNDRHARLAAGAGITLCTFLLETFELKRHK